MSNINFTSDLMGADITRPDNMINAIKLKGLFQQLQGKIQAAIRAKDINALKPAIDKAIETIKANPLDIFTTREKSLIEYNYNYLKKVIQHGIEIFASVSESAKPQPTRKAGLGMLLPLAAAGVGAFLLFK